MEADPVNLDKIGETPPAVAFLNGLGAIGLGNPTTRVIVSFLGISGLVYLFQPRVMFDDFGSPRPFALLSSDPDATFFPWFMPGVIFAIVTGIFM